MRHRGRAACSPVAHGTGGIAPHVHAKAEAFRCHFRSAKVHPHADYNVYKPGNTSTGLREFHETVRRMGGSKNDVVNYEPGKWGFTASDGTRLFFRRRFEGKNKQPTNEIHIDRAGDKLANIKIRYDD